MERLVNDYDDQGWTPLHVACKNGTWQIVNNLLAQGALVQARTRQGWRAVHIAAYYRHPVLVRMLLSNSETKVDWVTDVERNTPLHLAAAGGDPECVKLLVDAGALTEARNHVGYTPLHVAASENRPAAARALLQLGADPEAKVVRCRGWRSALLMRAVGLGALDGSAVGRDAGASRRRARD
jgi:ankyrin repeat protein